MEPIQKSTSESRRSLLTFPNGEEMWQFAETYVNLFRSNDLRSIWQDVLNASSKEITEHLFLREYTWCVHVAGFSAAVIATKIKKLLLEHNIEDEQGNYREITADTIVTDFTKVYAVFGNKNKANAIQRIRTMIMEDGWELFSSIAQSRDPEQYSGLPGIGPTLACHLARNLGNLHVVKPDIHLKRLSDHYGYIDPLDMCRTLSSEPEGLTDLKLWLAAADNGTKELPNKPVH